MSTERLWLIDALVDLRLCTSRTHQTGAAVRLSSAPVMFTREERINVSLTTQVISNVRIIDISGNSAATWRTEM